MRSIMWRLTDRDDLWGMVRAARKSRGLVARLVVEGQRDTYQWTPEKGRLLDALDEAGVSAIFADPEFGGPIAGPKSLATALAAYELAWVDGGAATCLIALGLALQPIISAGTDQQRAKYLRASVPSQEPGQAKQSIAGCVLPDRTAAVRRSGYGDAVGQSASGTEPARLAGHKAPLDEPLLHVQKRGRFTNNMDFANFVVVAVASDDPRIQGTCMIILEEGDAGTFDRGAVTHKLVHQLTSTRDPVFDMQVPASRIVGGYTIQDGVIVPNYNHAQILEAVFSRTRVPAGVMTGAKLLSSVEPIIRYQRERFRGGEGQPGTPRHDLGLQTKEDALHRLVDIWAAGEAACSLGFAAARHFDSYAELEKQKHEIFAAEGMHLGSGPHRIPKEAEQLALEYLRLCVAPDDERNDTRLAELAKSRVIDFVVRQAVGKVLSPATKLWNTGQGAMQLRQAVSLMGGYGITQDCPGFLPQKWMDSQLEATYEGPEAVQRRQLIVTMTSELFLAQFRKWTWDMGRISAERPGTGACTLAAAMDLWSWTLHYLQHAADADGAAALPRQAAGGHVPHGRRDLLAARVVLPDPRHDRIGDARRRRSASGRVARRVRAVLHRSVPRAGGSSGRRSGPHLRGTCVWLQSPSELGAGLRLVHGRRRTGWARRTHPRHLGRRAPGRRCRGRGWHALAQSRTLRAFRRLERVRRPAQQTRRLPHRLTTRQRPCRLRTLASRDPREAGLSAVGEYTEEREKTKTRAGLTG